MLDEEDYEIPVVFFRYVFKMLVEDEEIDVRGRNNGCSINCMVDSCDYFIRSK